MHYIEAFNRSDFEAMLNYYRANYPRPDQDPSAAAPAPLPKVSVPVLEFHGLGDQALLPGALSGTWDLVEKDFTLVTIPGAGHFVQQDAADLVSTTMSDWLGPANSLSEFARGSVESPARGRRKRAACRKRTRFGF